MSEFIKTEDNNIECIQCVFNLHKYLFEDENYLNAWLNIIDTFDDNINFELYIKYHPEEEVYKIPQTQGQNIKELVNDMVELIEKIKEDEIMKLIILRRKGGEEWRW